MTDDRIDPAPAGPGVEGGPARPSGVKRFVLGLIHVVLTFAVLAVGVLIAVRFIATAPQVEHRAQEQSVTLVEVQGIEFGNHEVTVEAMGTARPAREIALVPRVSGEIIEVSTELIPGGLFEAGDQIVWIDPSDYDLAVRQRESELIQAQADLRIEEGEQAVARDELNLLGEVVADEEIDLVLREPQLASAQAKVEAAQAALEQAQLDLQRTQVTAPFNAVVQSRNVELGTQVSSTTTIATLVGTDADWIELAVPVDRLRWIHIPRSADEQGSSVRIFNEAAWGDDVCRIGHVIRLSSDLEDEGRMAVVIVELEDPLALREENADQPPLLLNSYVRAEIAGNSLGRSAALDRGLLRDGDRVWIMNPDGSLDIRPVTVTHRMREQVLVTDGITEGEQLVVSDLPAPVAGMPLRTRDEEIGVSAVATETAIPESEREI